MPTFSDKSRGLLSGCDIRLQKICSTAIDIMDFTIITGYRTTGEQERAFNEGLSKVKSGGKHNIFPSQAIDIAPSPIDWNDNARFYVLAGIMLASARMQNIKIKWGGDWNGNFNLKENHFQDLGHFELV